MTSNPYESPENRADLPRQQTNWTRLLVRLLIVVGILSILVVLLLPARRSAPEAARRMQCSNALKQIGLALQNYHDTYGSLPPAYTVDSEGKPLHSWRTLILPFMEAKTLYDQVDLSKPWDAPANKTLRESNVRAYHCPSNIIDREPTTYLAVLAPDGCFRGQEAVPYTKITDVTSHTLLVIEVPNELAVPWMSPRDTTEAAFVEAMKKSQPHRNVTIAVFADGHTSAVTKNTPANVLRAFVSADGNDNDVAQLAD